MPIRDKYLQQLQVRLHIEDRHEYLQLLNLDSSLERFREKIFQLQLFQIIFN